MDHKDPENPRGKLRLLYEAAPIAMIAAMKTAFDERRVTIASMLDAIDGIECLMPEGAFYAFPSLQGLIGRTLGGREMTSTLDIASVDRDIAAIRKQLNTTDQETDAQGYSELLQELIALEQRKRDLRSERD